jgi:hypothetical protein
VVRESYRKIGQSYSSIKRRLGGRGGRGDDDSWYSVDASMLPPFSSLVSFKEVDIGHKAGYYYHDTGGLPSPSTAFLLASVPPEWDVSLERPPENTFGFRLDY